MDEIKEEHEWNYHGFKMIPCNAIWSLGQMVPKFQLDPDPKMQKMQNVK